MDLSHAQGKQNLYKYIKELGEEHGITIDRVRVRGGSLGVINQNEVLIEKQVSSDEYMKMVTMIGEQPELEDADPKFDPVAQKLEMKVRELKDRLTDRIRYQGHNFEFYPYDDGEAYCLRCDEGLEMPIGMEDYERACIGEFDELEYDEPTFTKSKPFVRPRVRALMKRYIHGWAIEHPCDQVIERKSIYHEP